MGNIEQIVKNTDGRGVLQKTKKLGLLDEVMNLTSFLDECYSKISWSQRFWHIRIGKYGLVTCHNKDCNSLAVFAGSKYRCCGATCLKEFVKQRNVELYGVDSQFKRKNIQDSVQENNIFNNDDFKERQKEKTKNDFKLKYPDYEYISVSFDGNYRVYTIKHMTCGKNFEIPVNTLFKRGKHGNLCLHCHRIYSDSQGEKELYKFISSVYVGKIIRNTRSIISPKELDIYLPDQNLAFEYNGTYNHADPRFYKPNDKIRYLTTKEIWDKDKKKSEMCHNKGVKLITIWEHDWLNDNENIINHIGSILHLG